MARKRIEDIGDVRQMDRNPDYDRVHVKNVNPNDDVGPRPVHEVAGTGMNGIEVDLQRLAQAEQQLANLHGELVAHMNQASALSQPVRDGRSPITHHMRRAFLDRADVNGGVQGTLREYMRELFAVRGAILATLHSYQALDDDAVALLNRQAAELDEEKS